MIFCKLWGAGISPFYILSILESVVLSISNRIPIIQKTVFPARSMINLSFRHTVPQLRALKVLYHRYEIHLLWQYS